MPAKRKGRVAISHARSYSSARRNSGWSYNFMYDARADGHDSIVPDGRRRVHV